MGQLSLIPGLELGERRPWKRVRPTSIAQYAHLRDTGVAEQRRACVLRAVAAMRNATQVWPTACEVQAWLEERREIPDDGNPNHVKPRLSELADGWEVTRVVDGRKVRVRVGGGVLERGPKRKSQQSGIRVLTWQVKSR